MSGGSRLSRLLSVRCSFSALPYSLVLERLLDGDTSRSTGAIIQVKAALIELNVDVGASSVLPLLLAELERRLRLLR